MKTHLLLSICLLFTTQLFLHPTTSTPTSLTYYISNHHLPNTTQCGLSEQTPCFTLRQVFASVHPIIQQMIHSQQNDSLLQLDLNIMVLEDLIEGSDYHCEIPFGFDTGVKNVEIDLVIRGFPEGRRKRVSCLWWDVVSVPLFDSRYNTLIRSTRLFWIDLDNIANCFVEIGNCALVESSILCSDRDILVSQSHLELTQVKSDTGGRVEFFNTSFSFSSIELSRYMDVISLNHASLSETTIHIKNSGVFLLNNSIVTCGNQIDFSAMQKIHIDHTQFIFGSTPKVSYPYNMYGNLILNVTITHSHFTQHIHRAMWIFNSVDYFGMKHVTIENNHVTTEQSSPFIVKVVNTLEMFDIVCRNNTGGCVKVENGQSVFVRGCEFTDNTCDNSGGALHIDANLLVVNESTFSNNFASKGGAIFTTAKTFLYNSTFEWNSANLSGGAFYQDIPTDGNSKVVYLTSCHFGNNAVRNSNGFCYSYLDCIGSGGALSIGSLRGVENVTIVNNSAAWGAGLFVASSYNANYGSDVWLSENSASIAGGCFFSFFLDVYNAPECRNNTAVLYGPDVASYITKFRVKETLYNTNNEPTTVHEFVPYLTNNITELYLGQKILLQLLDMRDAFNQKIPEFRFQLDMNVTSPYTTHYHVHANQVNFSVELDPNPSTPPSGSGIIFITESTMYSFQVLPCPNGYVMNETMCTEGFPYLFQISLKKFQEIPSNGKHKSIMKCTGAKIILQQLCYLVHHHI